MSVINIPIVIIGAGFAGLSAADEIIKHSQYDVRVLEKSNVSGGIASSFIVQDFTFDYGIHGLYTKDQSIQDYLSNIIDGKHQKFNIKIVDYFKGYWVRHPLHLNLNQLPYSIKIPFGASYFKSQLVSFASKPNDFREWAFRNLGNAIAENVQFPYIRKFWTVEPEELTSDWMGPRIKRPQTRDLVAQSLGLALSNKHYVTEVLYPNCGGFGAYAHTLAKRIPISYDSEVVRLDTSNRTIFLGNGTQIKYEVVISTIPLPEIFNLLERVPPEILDSAKRLRYTSIALVSLGINKPNVLENHWVYAIDDDIVFARLSSPSLWSTENAPPGLSSLQAEVYFQGSPLSQDYLLKSVVNSLLRMHILDNEADIIMSDVRTRKYANIIHDFDRQDNVLRLHNFLDERGILYCGRYAQWDYSLIDAVINNSIHTSQRAISILNSIKSG